MLIARATLLRLLRPTIVVRSGADKDSRRIRQRSIELSEAINAADFRHSRFAVHADLVMNIGTFTRTVSGTDHLSSLP